jgi:hypothetical protein
MDESALWGDDQSFQETFFGASDTEAHPAKMSIAMAVSIQRITAMEVFSRR